MEVRRFDIEGLALIVPRLFEDHRGFFMESYNQREFQAAGIACTFVQDNHSFSKKNVLRGLHYQAGEAAQAKLLRCTAGEIFDVAVDIRPDSPTFGKWQGVVLSAVNRHQFFIPAGFAHGFLVLGGTAEVQYKCSQLYSSAHERGLMWNDPGIGIEWPLRGDPVLSPKDGGYPPFADLDRP